MSVRRLCRLTRRRFFCAGCVGLFLFLVWRLLVMFPFERDWTCEELKARAQIEGLCIAYTKDMVGGNLCHDLCISHELILSECVAHKNTTIVFSGKWKDQKIVFKTKRAPNHFVKLEEILLPRYEDEAITIDLQEEFAAHLYQHILNELSSTKLQNSTTPKEMLALMWKPHVLPNLTFTEMSSLWLLLHRDEFIRFQTLQNLQHIPQVYGFCGRFYAVEKVVSLEKITMRYFRSALPWKTRVKISLDLLDLAKELSSTPLGELHHCDIQPANFGLRGGIRTVSLDVDTVFTTKQIQDFLEQPTCNTDSDCEFFDCLSACNKTSRHCTRTLLTNNLQVMCRDIFLSHWAESGLLQRAPRHVAHELELVLTNCASSHGLPWQPRAKEAMYQTLYDLLHKQLKRVP